jgi:glycosyltransferase involved in cell wall biosynthesis
MPNLVGGGAESVVRSLCAGLPGEGIDVIAVTIYASGLDPIARATLGADLVDVGRRGRRDLGYFPRLVKTLRELAPDIVHAHLHTGQYAGRLAAALAGVPTIVFTAHGAEPESALRRTVDRMLDARTARFVVFTEAQRNDFGRKRGVPLERIAVIANGVPQPAVRDRASVRVALNIPASAFALYAAARFSPVKNHRLAIEALALLHGRDKPDDVHLVFAGTGPLESELRTFVRELGLTERVHFLGFRADAAALGNAMDLFVMPSIGERMPLALGEAMLIGLVPVVAPWEGCADFVRDGETGFIAADYSADAFAAAIRRARKARETGAAVAENAAAFAVNRFSLETMMRRHADLYRSLVGAPA